MPFATIVDSSLYVLAVAAGELGFEPRLTESEPSTSVDFVGLFLKNEKKRVFETSNG